MVTDEISTGWWRTGKFLNTDNENVKPDMICIGKGITGGILPISIVLWDDPIMLTIKPG